MYLWGLYGIIWDYIYIKVGGKYGKMGVFCGFLASFLCGSGWSSGKFGRGGGCKGVYFVGLWKYLYKFFELERIK